MQINFDEFLSAYNIAIPILQRDYVQGADKNSEKRNKFVKQLLDALLNNTVNMIDFIFGSSDTGKELKPYFIPVDGQQRLTTLSLLGWLLNHKCGNKYSHKLTVLTYTSRPSTEQFCKELRLFSLPHNYTKISEYIRNEPGWFSYSWLSDPSINSMLELLDYIDSLLCKKQYCENIEIISQRFFEQSPITLDMLDMKTMNLNDDLYIKMNARGKLLTPFENWKAAFEDFLCNRFSKDKYIAGEIIDAGKATINEYFEYAIEHEWCYMLWPIALDRWSKLSDEAKSMNFYPRIDEDFMNLIDFISRFLYYSSFPESELTNEEIDLYEHNTDSKRIGIYASKNNVELLFRMLDTLVAIQKNWGNFDDFFKLIFVSNESSKKPKASDATKVNLFDSISVDLVTLCLDGKMDYFREITLWAVMKWLIQHKECVEKGADLTPLTDYVRVLVGWARGRNQRITRGLNVNMNLRVNHYKESNAIIDELLTNTNLKDAILATKESSMAEERMKGKFYDSPKFDIIRKLSPCRSLFYCFNLLMPTIEEMSDTDIDDFIDKFYEFMALSDSVRILLLVKHGFIGVKTELSNFYFFGLQNKWDYIFTMKSNDVSFANTEASLIAAILHKPDKTSSLPELQYYITNYPDFIKARNNMRWPDVKETHYMKRNHWWEIWVVKTFSSNPLQGYNSEPFSFVVQQLYKGSALNLWSESEYSEHGKLWIKAKTSENYYLTMECVENGWLINCSNKGSKAYKVMLNRFEEIETPEGIITYSDTEGEFHFKEEILLDLAENDRIKTALAFIDVLDSLF